MRLAIAIAGGFKEDEADFAVPLDPTTAHVLAEFATDDLLALPRSPLIGDVGLVRLLGIERDEDGAHVARLSAGRRLGAIADLDRFLGGPFPLQLLSEQTYLAIVGAAEADTFAPVETTPRGEMSDLAASFDQRSVAADSTIGALLETLRRESKNRCALTGARLMFNSLPVAIRTAGADRLHVNNLLLLSSRAAEALRNGHVTARDDFSLIIDFARIDPELLERINPNGHLKVPKNMALQPAPANLAWHRREVFGLR